MKKRMLCILMTVVMMITLCPISGFASEVFPDNRIADMLDLETTGEEEFLENSDSVIYTEEDPDDAGELLEPSEGSDSAINGTEEDAGETVVTPANPISPFNSQENPNAGLPEEDISKDSMVATDEKNITQEELQTDKEDPGATDPGICADKGSISLKVAKSNMINFTATNCTGSVYMQFGLSNSSVIYASWGSWDGAAIPLNIKGKKTGTTKVYVYLKQAGTNRLLHSICVTVNIIQSSVSSPLDSFTLTKGTEKKLTFTVNGCYGNYYLEYSISDRDVISCSWGEWSDNTISLTITGRNGGNESVYVYLKDKETENTLSTAAVQVAVNTPELSLSSSRINLTAGNSEILTATYSNYSRNAFMQFRTTNANSYSCSWGSWSENSVPLTITGKGAGSGLVYVYLKDAKTKETLATGFFWITVAKDASVSASTFQASVKADASETVDFTVKGINSNFYLQYGTTNSNAYECVWNNNWNNGTVTMTINGKNAGYGRVNVYLKNTAGTTLASTSIEVTVTAQSLPGVNPVPSEDKTKKTDNQIQAGDLQKTTAKKDQSFSIDASALGNARLTYTSNQKNVKITSGGKVTIAKNYVGNVLITITAEETAAYKKTTKTITLMVRPGGTSITSLKSTSGKIKVNWKKNTAVNGYQIQYSLFKDFKSSKNIQIKKWKQQTASIKKLKKNKMYYVRIRTYKTVGKVKYYSNWSKIKKIKVKK